MQRMRDVLRCSRGGSLRAMVAEDRIAAAWSVVCGQRIAERTRLTAFSAGVLEVEVTDAAWQQQMRSMAPRLVHEMRSIAQVDVTDILFKLATNEKR